jgi:hypothetical protein
MEAKELLSVVRTGVGITTNPHGYSGQKDDLEIRWLCAGWESLREEEKRSLFTSILKTLGEEKLLHVTDCPPFTPPLNQEEGQHVDNLARFIANTARERVDAELLDPEHSGLEEALSALQEQYLRDAHISHLVLEDVPPDGFTFMPPDTETPRLNDGRAENQVAERDKVSDRRLAHEIGILHQPAFLDTRDFNRPLPVVHYSQIDLRDFPVDNKTLEPIAGENRIIILENLWKGFAVFHLEGKAFVSSFNPAIDALIKGFELHEPQTVLSRESFEGMLRAIEGRQDFGTRTLIPAETSEINHYEHRSFDAKALVQLLTEHVDGPLYLKSARTAGGKDILKIWRDPQEGLVVESNSDDVVNRYADRIARMEKLLSLQQTIKVLVKQWAGALTPQRILEEYVSQMEAPIVEAAIPMAPCNGGRAEARIIYQTDRKGALARTGAYCKFSKTQVAANVSLGGHGITVEDAINHMLNGQNVDARTLQNEAKTTLERLMRDVDAFAHEFRRRKETTLDEFGVDVAFVWNKETSQVDFYLIEVQRGFAFEGLKQVDPEAASVVEQRRRHRIENNRTMQIMSRLFGPHNNNDVTTKL